MLPVSRSSPENSRPLGLLFSNNLNLHIKISNFLAKSDHFEHFLKNSIFENFDPFCMGRNWFWDFQFSGWIRRFWAFFKKLCYCDGKKWLNLINFFLCMGKKWLNLINFFPYMGKNWLNLINFFHHNRTILSYDKIVLLWMEKSD